MDFYFLNSLSLFTLVDDSMTTAYLVDVKVQMLSFVNAHNLKKGAYSCTSPNAMFVCSLFFKNLC